MRKCLILTALALWLVFILAVIIVIFNMDSIHNTSDSPILMLAESETTEELESETDFAGLETKPLPYENEGAVELNEMTFMTEPSYFESKSEETTIPKENKKLSVPETTPSSQSQRREMEEVTEPANMIPTQGPISEPVEETIPTEQEQVAEANGTSSFSACEISTNEISRLRYWLYTPSNPTDNMPLIVYLHGGSGKGDDLNRITSVDGFPQYLQSGALGDVRAYVVIPQLPSNQRGWEGIYSTLYGLIESIISEYSIDTYNISLTGHSMGGTGTWNFAAAYPTLFARIAPLSGGMRNTANMAEQLKDISVWAFVGAEDTIVSPESSEEVIALVQQSGGDAQITVLDGADHFSVPSLSYLNEGFNLLGWLIGSNR